ncbi:hypothetical protein EVAR_81795_1 [Eumeta japonica]|uniref:Uncharacterized protein n=1 Tax=Eumeta variegata TaxID=151549 RepID=A0A4C1UIC7_EUMVA|nr:hypothetical protein EVAR_81795_1 [Eumeta japonica]
MAKLQEFLVDYSTLKMVVTISCIDISFGECRRRPIFTQIFKEVITSTAKIIEPILDRAMRWSFITKYLSRNTDSENFDRLSFEVTCLPIRVLEIQRHHRLSVVPDTAR